MVDTGVTGKSTAGYNQCLVYSRLFPAQPIDTTHKGSVNTKFGVSLAFSNGRISIARPIGPCKFHIVKANISFLLGLNNMNKRDIILDELNDQLISTTDKYITITRKYGHHYLT